MGFSRKLNYREKSFTSQKGVQIWAVSSSVKKRTIRIPVTNPVIHVQIIIEIKHLERRTSSAVRCEVDKGAKHSCSRKSLRVKQVFRATNLYGFLASKFLKQGPAARWYSTTNLVNITKGRIRTKVQSHFGLSGRIDGVSSKIELSGKIVVESKRCSDLSSLIEYEKRTIRTPGTNPVIDVQMMIEIKHLQHGVSSAARY
jgi:hypothetical protein